jgi:transcriptional regulator with XRE-family HTH domain
MARTPISLPFNPDRLRVQRERCGLTQEDLAQRTVDQGTPVERSTISHLENGRRSPLARTLKSLADALGVGIDELLDKPPVGRAS